MIITAVNAFELFATLSLQTTAFENALKKAQSTAATAGNGIKSGFSGISDLFTSAGEAIKNGLETAVKTATAAITAASAAVVGLGKKAIDAGMSFDSAMSQVAATMGRTVEDLNDDIATVKLPSGEEFTGNLRDFAKKMGAETKFSATEAAGALNYMALAGYSVTESMEMMPNVLNLASAGGMQLQQASDMLTDTQKALGLSFERTNQLVDEMAKAASTGNTSVSQLGEAFLTVGGLAKEANGGFVTLSDGTQAAVDGVQEMEIAFTAMANAGVKGSEAGTHMRNMLLKLASPTEAGTKAFEGMGISVYDTEGRMRSLKDIFSDLNVAFGNMSQADKLAKISDIFNARDTASAEALLAAVEQDWDKIGESILNAEGAAQRMANTQLDNLSGNITKFKSALEGVYIEISEKLTPALVDFVKIGQETLSNLIPAIKAGDFNSITRILENAFTQALDKVTTLVPKVLQIAGTLVSTLAKGIIRNIPHVLKVVKQSLEKANKGDIGSSLITQIFDDISNSLPTIGRFVREIIKSLTKRFSQRIPELTKSTTKLITSIAVELTKPSNISAIINAGISLVLALARGFTASLSVIAEKAPEIIDNIKQGFSKNEGKLKTAGHYLWRSIKNGFVNAVGELDFDTVKTNFVEPLMSAFSENVGGFYESVIKPAWDFAVQKFPELINGIVDVIDFGEIASALSTFIIDFMNGVSQFVDNIDWDNIAAKISDFLNNIDWVGILTAVFNLMGTLISKSPQILKSFQDNLDEKFKFIAEIVGLGFAVKFIAKVAAAMASDGTIMTTFATIRTALSTNINLGAAEGGVGFATKFVAALSAFLLGWHIGSAIYEHFQEEIDSTLEPVWEGLFSVAAFVSGDETLDSDSYAKRLEDEYKRGLANKEERIQKRRAQEALQNAKSQLNIPFFAKGGVVTKPTTAVIGEAGEEAVMPLENNTGWISKLAQRINAEITPTVNANPVINFDKAAEYNVNVNGQLKIGNLPETLKKVENSLLKINAIITPEIKTNGIQGISDSLNRISETELIINPVVSDFETPEISDGTRTIKTYLENPEISEIPDTIRKISTIFNNFDIPKISNDTRKINTEFEEYKEPAVDDTERKVNTNFENFQSPEISDKISNVKTVFEKFNIPEIPEILAEIKTNFEKIEIPQIPDRTASINSAFEPLSVPDVPKLSTEITSKFGAFEIPEIADRISNVKTEFQPFEIPQIEGLTSKIKTVFEKFDIPQMPDLSTKANVNFEKIQSPEIPNLFTKIKTVFETIDIPIIPDVISKVKTIFEKFNAPEISDISVNANAKFSEFEPPEITDRTATVNYQNSEIPEAPVISDITAKIKTIFEKFSVPDIPDSTSTINAILKDFEIPEFEDIKVKIRGFFENFDIPQMPESVSNIKTIFEEIDTPEIPDIIAKIKTVFEDFNIPEMPENRFRVAPEFEMPDVGTLQYTAQSKTEREESEDKIIIENITIQMDNQISSEYDVDKMSERFIKKLSDKIDTYKYRNRRGVGGTS